MSGADLMLSSGLISALGWALVHFLWQGCVVAVLFWAVCVLFRRESALICYWAGVGGLILSLAALVATFVIYYEPDATFIAAPAVPESVNTFLLLSGSTPDLWGLLQDGIEPALPLLVLLWFSGVLVSSGRTALDWLRIRRLVRRDASEVGRSLDQAARRLESELGLKRAVRILQSGRIVVPMAVGWIRPVVLMPASVLAQLPRDQLEMVLAHELGHIRRWDHMVNWLQIGLETVLFYHPAIRWISRRVREERENCCDDLVVARCGKPATYARALTNLEVLRGPHPGAAVMAATGGNLLGRIRRIIDSELPRTSTAYAQIFVMAALALTVGLGTHQGIALSRALNQVASVAQLQPSDIEWQTWGRSRAAWGAGLVRYAEQGDVRGWVARSHSVMDVPAADEENENTEVVAAAAAVSDRSGSGADASNRRAETATQAIVPATLWTGRGLRQITLSGATVTRLPAAPSTAESRARSAMRAPEPSIHPVVLEKIEPRYPWRARAHELEGYVELAFSVGKDGQAYDIDVVDSVPIGIFDRVAKRAMQKWKFAPPVGAAAALRLTQTFDFDLKDIPAAEPRRRNCRTTGRRTCSYAPPDAIVVYVNPPSDRKDDFDSHSLD